MGYTGLWVFKSEAAKVPVAPLYQQRATEQRLLLLLKLKSCFYQNSCDFKFILVGREIRVFLINNILPHSTSVHFYCLGIEIEALAIKQKAKYKSVKVICVQTVIIVYRDDSSR